ncbi:MAG: hypothetical protein ACE5J2_06940 [Nitrososphaerales archaeon]
MKSDKYAKKDKEQADRNIFLTKTRNHRALQFDVDGHPGGEVALSFGDEEPYDAIARYKNDY